MSNEQPPSRLGRNERSGSWSSPGDEMRLPMAPHGPVFADFFNGALVFGILKPEMLFARFPPHKVIESIDDKDRVAEIVHASIGTLPSVVKARYDARRYTEDIEAGMAADPEVAKKFQEAIGVDFFLEHMNEEELYQIVYGTGWMLSDKPHTRAFAASLCTSLVKHEAFGSPVRTLEHILFAITFEALMSDKVPHDLRARLLKAAYLGNRKTADRTRHVSEYLFVMNEIKHKDGSKEIIGVPFDELAGHLPVEPLARPFASYVEQLGLVKTGVNQPSELPPADHPAAAPPLFLPRPARSLTFEPQEPPPDGDD